MTTTTENIRTWATTNAGNASVDAAIASSDSQAPDTVDNNIRSIMTAARRESDDRGGAIVAGGTSTALTVTTASGIATAHIANGLTLYVRTASSATGAATIAVDGLTAVSIKNNAGGAIVSGDWASGAILILVYSSTATAFLCANVLTTSSLNISGLTEDTTPAHATDYLATYDTSASGNKKVLPKNLFPSTQASFSAHLGGSNQNVASSSPTKVTFSTEVFDVGGFFGSSKWTPPAGKVWLTASIYVSGQTAGQYMIGHIYKNGAAWKSNIIGLASSIGTLVVTAIDDANGTDYYEVFIEPNIDSGYVVEGASTLTFFMGSRV